MEDIAILYLGLVGLLGAYAREVDTCHFDALPREAWSDLSPTAFERAHAHRKCPLLLRGALHLELRDGPEAKQASKWTDYFKEHTRNMTLTDLPLAFAPEAHVAFGDALVLEDATHSALFTALRPFSSTFPRNGPLALLRAMQLVFVLPPGGGFGTHMHAKENSYNVLLHGALVLWHFPKDDQSIPELCQETFWPRGQEELGSIQVSKGGGGGICRSREPDNQSADFKTCIQLPGDAMWIPAGVQHAACVASSSAQGAVSAGGRGDVGGWTRAMLAARDGSIPLLQRAVNVAALDGKVSREINKVVQASLGDFLPTAVHLAASRGHAPVVEWLLKRRAESRPLSGETRGVPHAHHAAAMHGHVPALELLVAYRADVNARLVGLSGDGKTLLDLASEFGHSVVADWLTKQTGEERPEL
eukprot:TRINITY_DN44578_c0_g1_i1.p1 TRINITY_DN44578_c0_g1~~TRINITY_DN44578_c0_g1_i1.p1  ORF type:complete len:469 (+),score=51.37 TRINITY_DN44578_c0_g1_i1:159-1409(+)